MKTNKHTMELWSIKAPSPAARPHEERCGLRVALVALALLFLALPSEAQMWNGQDTLYGNEWINYDQTYYKIPVSEDGLYRIPYEAMQSAGLPLNSIAGAQLQLFHLGEEQPIYVTTSGTLDNDDYVEFYGEKNRSELDRYLFGERDSTMLNPWYSLVTDTAAYFLTWAEAGQPTLRYETVLNDLTNLPPKEEWYWAEEAVFYTNSFRKVYDNVSGATIYHSYYIGEGFASNLSGQYNLSIPSSGVFSSGPASSMELRLVSNANTDGHELEVSIDGSLAVEESFYGSQFRNYALELNTASLSDEVDVEISGLNNADRYAIGGMSLRYPKVTDAEGSEAILMELPGSTGERYLEVENLNGNGNPVLLDLSNNLRLLPVEEEGAWKAKLPSASGVRRVLLSREASTVMNLRPHTFTDYTSDDHEYVIITSRLLREGTSGIDQVQAYADYRASAAGGNYNTLLIEVENLYEQFAYGLNRHPLSVRNFVNYLQKETGGLKYCFIIGKGQEYPDVRNAASLQNAVSQGFFHVPSYGSPASDNLLLARGASVVPTVPVGRLAAISGEEVKTYLDKVQAMEAQFNNPQTIAERAWMKQILHLGGGSSAAEQSTIKAYLESMAAEAERNLYGAEVNAFYKTSTDPIQTSLSEQIFNTINKGTSIITFFGHSSPGTFDFNIDNPDNYLNTNKYPLMLSLGCYSGNVFVDGRSIGERFTFYENKATVAFGASRGVGFISSLGSFARSYYANLGGSYYGQGIGDALKATLEEYSSQPFIGTATLVEQFTLHGDPAIRLYPAPGPDYVLDPSSVTFEPSVVTADRDSFIMKLDVLNLGTNPGDTVSLSISRRLPDGTEGEVLRDTISITEYRQTFTYRLPTEGRKGVGQNTINALIDADDFTAELPAPAAEMNNRLQRSNGAEGIPLFIIDNTARPVYPPEFAIVGEDDITLKSSTTDALAPERTYLLEVDTTGAFDSPLKLSTSITQRGGVIEWTPNLSWQDSTIYYWRISPDSISEEVGYVWEESSFTFMEGSEGGWRQGGYWQFRKNDVKNILIDSIYRQLRFTSNFTDLRIVNKVYEGNDRPEGYINGSRWSDFFRWEASQSINIAVFDSLGRIMWNDLPGEYGSLNTTATKEIACFPFPVETVEQRVNIINFLDDIVQPGSTVYFYNALRNFNKDLNINEWAADSTAHPGGKNIYKILEEEGSALVREMEDEMRPYLFIYKKGEGVIWEEITDTPEGRIDHLYSVEGFWTEGTFYSPRIGPAEEWKTLNWDNTLVEETDSMRLDLVGYRANGSQALLAEDVDPSNLDLSFINSENFPYIALELFCMDTVATTAPILNNWSVTFDATPELALNPDINYFFYKDTLQQGDSLRLKTIIQNLSDEAIDSSVFQLQIYNESFELLEEKEFRASLNENGEAFIDASLSTKSLIGLNRLLLSVNRDQKPLERYFINNQLNQFFYVQSDVRAPVLDVTFDGNHIQDGDLVSASPTINISLEDENPYFLLDDTSDFTINLVTPDGNTEVIRFSDPEVLFEPPTDAEENKALITFKPELPESGIYQLEVRASDIAGNESGVLNYQVDFEVVTESTVANVLNYPNPFTTSTQFVYTLTGKEPPADFYIRIMTVSGRVVKTIQLHQYEELRVGTHRTDYRWDGTDEYGDRLANGVYLYQVMVKSPNGEEYEHRSTSIDGYFKNGIGKMVIFR